MHPFLSKGFGYGPHGWTIAIGGAGDIGRAPGGVGRGISARTVDTKRHNVTSSVEALDILVSRNEGLFECLGAMTRMP
jgi:hypothetical protein